MNEFLAFDDADWELASAYLDNEVTSAERAQVEASPALLGLVADLRSMQTSVAAQPPAAIDRDAMITAALAGAPDEPVVGRVAGSGGLGDELAAPPPHAVAPVTSISAARKRRAEFLKAPMLLAAALLTVMGIGFALRSGSRGDSQKTSSGAATTAAAIAKAAQDQSTGSNAVPPVEGAAPATTEAFAASPAPSAAATTAAATATTAAPAATTAAAATNDAAKTTVAAASATTAAPAAANPTSTAAAATSAPATTAAGPPVPTLTLQELRDLVVASAANPAAQSTLVCPDPRGVPRLSVQILWNGQPAIVFIDQISQTLVVLAVNGCTPVANILIKDLAQS
jgi:trimeric autotransporter adhesin